MSSLYIIILQYKQLLFIVKIEKSLGIYRQIIYIW